MTEPQVPQLMKKIASGDELAFKELYDLFGGYVFKIVNLSLRNPAKSEELTQEIFLKIWRFAGKYDTERPFKPWLSRLVSNEVISWFRVKKEDSESLEDMREVGFEPSVRDADPDSGSDVSAAISESLASLTDNQRQVVVLKFYQGLKIREVADTLGIGESAVKARLYTALETIARKMKEKGLT
ncbi:MAG: RNA polymerase sigma factor [Caldiserica bacterium]|nr:RNA polymerase sigma factor [Caldisericota bacterium]